MTIIHTKQFPNFQTIKLIWTILLVHKILSFSIHDKPLLSIKHNCNVFSLPQVWPLQGSESQPSWSSTPWQLNQSCFERENYTYSETNSSSYVMNKTCIQLASTSSLLQSTFNCCVQPLSYAFNCCSITPISPWTMVSTTPAVCLIPQLKTGDEEYQVIKVGYSTY